MAIDFMVLPLSRYISGDFVTPNMRLAWEQGVPYAILGPEGRREFPRDTPFGGPDAPARREAIFELLAGDLALLPAPIPAQLWDERTAAEPCFHRVDPRAFGALVEAASRPGKTWLGLLKKAAPPSHLTASLFLPCDFEPPFEMASPLLRPTGSAVRALTELASTRWPEAAAGAVETLRAALSDANRLRLPMIVDS